MKYYKFLTVDNRGEYSKFDFTEYLPKNGRAGRWLRKIENIGMCKSGYHAFEPKHILEWGNAQLFEVELSGDMIGGYTKIVAQRMRFLRKVDTWNDKTARLFACYCARDVLPIFEKEYPNDKRPRAAIETSERYANGEATDSELSVALDAAWATARAAERAAASDVTWNAARAAAWSAARATARATAWATVWAAARAAERDVARATAWDAEMAKYTAHLIEMLGLEDK